MCKLKNHKKTIFLSLIIIFSIVCIIFLLNSNKGEFVGYFYGKVEACSSNSFVLLEQPSTKSEQPFYIFLIDDSTLVYDLEGNEISYSDIEPNMRVSVAYYFQGKDTNRSNQSKIDAAEIRIIA